MDDYDDDNRNAAYDDDDDERNADFRNKKKRPVVVYRYPAPAPWPPAPARTERRVLKDVRFGEWIDAAAQVLVAVQPLPNPPNAVEEGRANLQNLITYQAALAQYAKRNEQFRTLGVLARTFLR
jgi:hypothetical protein